MTEQKIKQIEEDLLMVKKDIDYFKHIMAQKTHDHDLLIKIAENLESIKEAFPKLVRRHEFEPVRNAVFGVAGFMVLSVIGALLALVFKL